MIVDLERLGADRRLLSRILPLCREINRRLDHPSETYVPDTSTRRPQLQAHRSDAYIRYISGGNQSGKSRWGAQEVVWWLTETHPWLNTPPAPHIWVISATWSTIQNGIWRHLMREGVMPRWEISGLGPRVAGTTDVRRALYTKNGGIVEFISAQGGEEARKKAQAAAVDFVVIDEEIADDVWQEISMRLLRSGGKVAITATPWVSPQWLLDIEDQALGDEGDVAMWNFETRRAAEVGHIKRRHYQRQLATLSDEDREVRLEGKTRRRHGLVYEEFSPVNLTQPYDIPGNWTRYCAIDPGWRTAAVLWAAVSPDRDHYVLYREVYLHGANLHALAERIYLLEGWRRLDSGVWVQEPGRTERIFRRWIDPSAYNTQTDGSMGYAHILHREHQIHCIPARNDLEVGIEYCKRDLMPDMGGVPRCMVFRSLDNFIKEVRSYRRHRDTGSLWRSEKTDKPIGRHDHLLDAWRYLVLGGLHYDRGKRDFGDAGWVKEFEEREWQVADRAERRRLRDLRAAALRKHSPRPLVGGVGSEA